MLCFRFLNTEHLSKLYSFVLKTKWITKNKYVRKKIETVLDNGTTVIVFSRTLSLDSLVWENIRCRGRWLQLPCSVPWLGGALDTLMSSCFPDSCSCRCHNQLQIPYQQHLNIEIKEVMTKSRTNLKCCIPRFHKYFNKTYFLKPAMALDAEKTL